MTRVVALTLWLVLVQAGSEATGESWYVDVDGIPGVDCDCVTIQACIDSASAGDTVLVACGTYYEHDIVMKSGIRLGSETGQPDCVTIDAQGEGRVIHCADVESTTRIEGLTITGGVLTGIGCAYTGAGIYCERSSPTIASCNISGNTAGGGGGLSCCQNSAPSLVNVVICGNSAEAGAGMQCDHSAPTLANCMFSENTAPGGYGGGIYTWASSLALTGVRFSANSADVGGGLCGDLGSSFELSYCTFFGNFAAWEGGGMELLYYGPTRLVNCTFYGNSAGGGGAIFCAFDYELIMENTILAFNNGLEGPVICGWHSDATASCCDVYGNEGGDWVGCLSGQLGVNGNFSECPLFCDLANDIYSLQECSPCAPGNHPTGYDCGLIGAFDIGCECGLPSIVKRGSWGAVKAMYR